MKKNKIPLSIERTEVSAYNYFFNEKKMIALIATFIGGAILTFLLVKMLSAMVINGMAYGMVIGITATVVAYFFIFRFVVFEEKRQRRLLKKLQDEQLSAYDSFWEISTIDKDSGLIHFRPDGDKIKKAVVIEVTRGSIVARNAKFYEYYQKTLTLFKRDLLTEGYKIRQYSMAKTGSIPENLQHLIDKANAIKNPKARQVAIMYTDNLLSKVKLSKAIEVDYYMIYCDQYYKMREFHQTVRRIMLSNFESNFFKDKQILDRQGVMQFFAEVLQVKAFPIIDQNATVPFSEYGEVVRAFDDADNELFIEQLESEFTEGPEQHNEEDEDWEEDENLTTRQRIAQTFNIDFNLATETSLKEKAEEISLIKSLDQQEAEKQAQVEDESENLVEIFKNKL